MKVFLELTLNRDFALNMFKECFLKVTPLLALQKTCVKVLGHEFFLRSTVKEIPQHLFFLGLGFNFYTS